MKRTSVTIRLAGVVAGMIFSIGLLSGAAAQTYEITVKNLTYGQIFSPPLAVAHRRSISVFTAGEPVGNGLEILAEDGSPAALENELILAGGDVAINDGPVLPGDSATFELKARGRNRVVSVVGMLVTTNDAFFGLNSVRPRGGRTVRRVVAYDAGTEVNDELCVQIPGPPCGNGGAEITLGENGDDENFVVHVHRGVHTDSDGVATLNAARDDWRNPVAEIIIRRKRGGKYVEDDDDSDE